MSYLTTEQWRALSRFAQMTSTSSLTTPAQAKLNQAVASLLSKGVPMTQIKKLIGMGAGIKPRVVRRRRAAARRV